MTSSACSRRTLDTSRDTEHRPVIGLLGDLVEPEYLHPALWGTSHSSYEMGGKMPDFAHFNPPFQATPEEGAGEAAPRAEG